MTKLSGLKNASVDHMVRGLRATARNIEATAVELENCEACKVEPPSGPADCFGQIRPLCKDRKLIRLKIQTILDVPRPSYIPLPYETPRAKHTITIGLNDFWVQEEDITPGDPVS